MRGLHAFGVDDNADHALALRQILFFVWVTFAEHKWIILAEPRRQASGCDRGGGLFHHRGLDPPGFDEVPGALLNRPVES